MTKTIGSNRQGHDDCSELDELVFSGWEEFAAISGQIQSRRGYQRVER
ncbi:MAG: hypothetical protein AAF226_18900 [Verrucomicrobiota bacterium]